MTFFDPPTSLKPQVVQKLEPEECRALFEEWLSGNRAVPFNDYLGIPEDHYDDIAERYPSEIAQALGR